MLFNSVAFLVFLPVVFGVYWALPRRGQNLFVLAASYFFYGWWDWRFLGLIFLSSLVDYLAGRAIARRRRPRGWLALSLGVNLGALGVFKYLDFGIESMSWMLRAVGFEPHPTTLSVLLPVGISFYTFQTLSYTIDIYRGKTEPTRDLIAFFAFVAFFPQLVAGPIERARNLLPQFERDRSFDDVAASDAALQILYGFWLKMVVADNIAMAADWCFAKPSPTGWIVLLGAWAFAFQIYGDFAGYSHIAIGCARLFGFSLMRNFAYPYFARSPVEFWRRWHISLSTWFRDYVYIPLGGNRRGRGRRYFNLLVTFGLSGLWHGAGLNFVVWGLYHGVLAALPWRREAFDVDRPLGKSGRSARALLGAVVTFHLVALGWILFRSETLAHAWTMIRALGQNWSGEPVWNYWMWPALATVALEWWQRKRPHGLSLSEAPAVVRWAVAFAVAILIVWFGRIETVPFIYFQF
ncbi:MAG: MBOAT family O-acyltransferase [Thermoanaerobaculia bacterium]